MEVHGIHRLAVSRTCIIIQRKLKLAIAGMDSAHEE
jgi:hypothetical protein